MKITKVVILFYGLGIFIVGLAGIVWLLSGHTPQPSLTTNTPGFGGENIVLYGVIVLALLGVEVPLHMAAEMKGRTTASLFLHNLIANALRYSPNKTSIRITAQIEQEHEMAGIRVIDQGAGIPFEKQEVIFDKFVRLERDVHGINRGSGLGLYITRQLVEAMGGTITVESSGIVGEGSTFSFTLPMQEIVLSSKDAIHLDLSYKRH